MGEITVKITPPLADYVEDLVARGRYDSVEDAVADALSRLQDAYVETPEELEALKKRLQVARDEIAAGEFVAWDPDELMREVDRRLASR